MATPEWTEKRVEGLKLDRKERPPEPRFGPLPEPTTPKFKPKNQFRYASLLDKVRQHPQQWACIAVFDHESPEKTLSRQRNVRNQIHRYLRRDFPLEVWTISERRIADTWCKRELWIRYDGVLEPEEMATLQAARRATWEKGRVNGQRKRTAKEVRARLVLMAQQRERRNAQGMR